MRRQLQCNSLAADAAVLSQSFLNKGAHLESDQCELRAKLIALSMPHSMHQCVTASRWV